MRMKFLLAGAALAAGACGGDDGGDAPDARPPLEGGRATPAGCSHEVVTPVYAEAPVVGVDGLGADPTPFHLRLGIAADPATSIAILWRTDDATTSTKVRYGVGGALDQTADGLTFRYASGFDGIGELLRVHETHLCGLAPDTEYSYQVGGVGEDGAEHWSPTSTFRTAPDVAVTPDAEVRVAYVGDSRGGYDVWADVAAELAARAPDLIVFTGDIVTIGQAQEEWDAFFDGAAGLLATTPVIAAHGNHEINAVHYYAQLAMPGDEQLFSIDYGHLHQVVVNSDPLEAGDLETRIVDFLEADLAATAARWKAVTMHRALYSSSTRHGSDDTLRAAWSPIFDAHLVDLVVSGHDHIFERTRPVRGGVVGATPADGTIYMVSGGAGAPLYSVLPEDEREPWFEVAESTHNGTVMSIRRDLLSSESFRRDGSPLDAFTISKP